MPVVSGSPGMGTAVLPPELAQDGRTGVAWVVGACHGVTVALGASVFSNRSAGQRFPAVSFAHQMAWQSLHRGRPAECGRERQSIQIPAR